MTSLGTATPCTPERHVMFARAILALAPDAIYSIEYDTIISWDSDDITKPTQAQIDAKITELEAAEPLRQLREKRDQLLKQTDWVSGEDVPQPIKDAWFPYRQALRDITNTYTSLDDVVWPSKP